MADDSAPTTLDRRAREIWEARASATALAGDEWGAVSIDEAWTIFDELGAALESSGSPQIGAKIGEPDAETQAKMGINGPVIAKTYANSLLEDGATLSLGNLVSPLVEMEIGLRVGPDGAKPVPCIEVVDSRFNWEVEGGQLIADLASSAHLIFGPSVDDPPATVKAVASCNGEVIADGSRELQEALDKLPKVEPALPNRDGEEEHLIATGSLNTPAPLAPGEWEFDFGDLGKLTMTVEE
jgi:2-keto-4-pentenoate hydratase